MKRILPTLLAILTGYAASASEHSYQPALSELHIQDQSGTRDLDGLLWYPTNAPGPLSDDYTSKVWVSTQVAKDAPPASGPFPLVVLSHGMFGNAMNQAWLAGALAKRGYVVAAISHPGTSTWSRDPDQRRELWQRPKDISRVIDHATTSPGLPLLSIPTGYSWPGIRSAASPPPLWRAGAMTRPS
ncbi:hypothetical protein N4R57_18480 [Rhodobacteraceae bacterium D3-12]|nr:hypothetical protein N4R57_18480 [Rhodobacteraceae bacterium D3-12]